MNFINSILCFLGFHKGKDIGKGHVIVLCKRNKPQEPIPGLWEVKKCLICKEVYAYFCGV